jgi:hypothetical protein
MTRLPALTDDTLRRALAPDPGLGVPVELLASIAEEVARTPQRRGVLAWRPGLGGAAHGRRTWVLVAAVALLALVAGLLVTSGGRLQPNLRPALVLPPLVIAGEYDAQFLAVGPEDAWVSDRGGALWHGTAAGWTGPESSGLSDVRALALLPDSRPVVAGDGGLRVRQLDGHWTVLNEYEQRGMAIDSDGTIWVSGGRDLAGFREAEGGWNRESRVECPAGGFFLAAAADGTIWTGGFAYTGNAGLARLDGTRCDEVKLPDGRRREVYDLAAGPGGQVVVRMAGLAIGEYGSRPDSIDPGLQTVLWSGSAWTTLASESNPMYTGLVIGLNGDVYAAAGREIRRHRDGRWETVVDQVVFSEDQPTWGRNGLTTSSDGTLWYATWRSPHSLVVEQVPTPELGD